MAKKRAAIYTRVSTNDQAQHGYSLGTQEESCRRYCQEHDWQVVGVYREEGVSGARLDRPALDQLRDDADAGKVDVLVAHDQDRLSRSAAHYLYLREELARRDVELHFALSGHAESDEDKLMETVKAAIAEYEHAKLSERVRRTIRGSVSAGSVRVHGNPPYGYKTVRENGRTRFEIVEEEARIVRLIFDWYTRGDGENGPLSMRAIGIRLTEMGVPTWGDKSKKRRQLTSKTAGRGEWSTSSIHVFLDNETYAGTWHFGKHKRDKKSGRMSRTDPSTWMAVEVPAIIDRQTWEAAQERRAQNKKKASRNSKYPLLLRCRVTCGHCGRKMCGSSRHHGTYLYYACHAGIDRSRNAVCDLPGSFRADHVDSTVWSWLYGLLVDPDALTHKLEEERAERERQLQPLRDRLAIVDDLLADSRRDMEKVLDLYLAGDFDKAILAERKTRLESVIAGLEEERGSLAAQLVDQSLTIEQVQTIEALSAEVREGLQDADFAFQRRIVDLLDVQARLCVEEGEKVAYVQCKIDPERRLSIVSARDSYCT